MKAINFTLMLLFLFTSVTSAAAVYTPSKVWKKSQVKYYFFKDSRQKFRVEKFEKAVAFINRAIGKQLLVPTSNYKESDIRVKYDLPKEHSLGSSQIGTDALLVKKTKPTLHFYVSENKNPSMNTILHEILHALGILHEHQNPQALKFSSYSLDERNSDTKSKELAKGFDYDDSLIDNAINIADSLTSNYSLFDPVSIMDYCFTHSNLSTRSFRIALDKTTHLVSDEKMFLSPMDIAIVRYLYNSDFRKKYSKIHNIRLDLSTYKTSNSDSFKFEAMQSESNWGFKVDFQHPLFINTKMKFSPLLFEKTEVTLNHAPIKTSKLNYDNPLFNYMSLGENLVTFKSKGESLPLHAYMFEMEFIEIDFNEVKRIAKSLSNRFINPNTIWFQIIGKELEETSEGDSWIDIFDEDYQQEIAEGDIDEETQKDFEYRFYQAMNYSHILEQYKRIYQKNRIELDDAKTAYLLDTFTKKHAQNIKNIFSDFLVESVDVLSDEEKQKRLKTIVSNVPSGIEGLALARTAFYLLKNQDSDALSNFVNLENYVKQYSPEARDFIYRYLKNTHSKEAVTVFNRVFLQSKNLGASEGDYFLLGTSFAERLEGLYKQCAFSSSCTLNQIKNMDQLLSDYLKILNLKNDRELNLFWEGFNHVGTDSWNLTHLVAESLANLTKFTDLEILAAIIKAARSFKVLETYSVLKTDYKSVLGDLSFYYQAFDFIDFKPGKKSTWAEVDTSSTSDMRLAADNSVSLNAYLSWTWISQDKIYIASEHRPEDDEVVALRKIYGNLDNVINEIMLKPCSPSALSKYKYNYEMLAQSWFYPLRYVLLQSEKRFVNNTQSFCKPRFKTTSELYNYTKLMEALYDYK